MCVYLCVCVCVFVFVFVCVCVVTTPTSYLIDHSGMFCWIDPKGKRERGEREREPAFELVHTRIV